MRIPGRTSAVLCGLFALALVSGCCAGGRAVARHDGGKASPCGCGKAHPPDRGKAAPCDCGHGGPGAAGPMQEGMKRHAADVRKAVDALRANEKTLEAATDPAAFRAAVIDHLKRVDDVEESHVRHMESMAGRATPPGGPGGPPCGKPCCAPGGEAKAAPCDKPCAEGKAAPPCDKPCAEGKAAPPAAK